jgi:superfamily II DNA or RNA helicase
MTVAAKKQLVDPDPILATVNNWDDLRAGLKVLSGIEKGYAFERFTQLYLQLSPVYKCKLRHVWLRHEVPSKLVSELNLPSTDKGIDLIAETFDGKYWAIQCKYRDDESASVTWDELSTFVGLAFGVCKKICFGLICSSTEHVTRVLRNQSQIGFCAIDTWRHLDQEFFDGIKLKVMAQPVMLMPKEPRPHQKRALEKGIAYFADETNTRGKLIAPCGSGKSLTGFWLAEALNSRLTLVAVPSLALIRQTLTVWLRESVALGKPVDWLCVCSDESAGNVEQDDLVVFAHDLGIPCTTDTEQIAEWLCVKSSNSRVIFTTYQSAHVVSGAARSVSCEFDVGIMDEAHKTVGRRDRLFSHLLFDENIKIGRRIFMTATERQYRGDSDEIVTMDDETIYGDTFELLTFKEAIEAQPPILSDYEVLIMSVSDDEVHQLIQNNSFVRPDKGTWGDLDAHTFAGLIAFRKAMSLERLNIKHAVSFHKSISGARKFTELQEPATNALSNCTPIHAFHVSGQMTTAKRDTILKNFGESPPSLVTNARCLTEGVDVPKIDCVFFADPRKSAIDIVQASGRAMRPAAGKIRGYIIVPVYIPTGAADDDIAESSAFNAVFNILRALASNDERMVEYFRAITHGRRPFSSLVQFNIDEITPQDVNTGDFVRALELRCWNKLARLSWRTFEDARSFVHSLNLRSYTEWRNYCRSGEKPPDIPASPSYLYTERWVSWGDWLGTGTIAPYLLEYRAFDDARTFVRALGLKNQEQWAEYCQSGNKPDDIPMAAWNVYKSEWISMGDWLGSGTVANRYKKQRQRSLEDASVFVRKLDLKSAREWRDYCASGEKPDDIPAYPDEAYSEKGWVTWGDFLGTGSVAPYLIEYRPFDNARAFVRALGLKSQEQWKEYCQSGNKPDDIPATPSSTYKTDGWKGVGDWLGTERQYKSFRNFVDARAYVHTLKLADTDEWKKYCRSDDRPKDIPKAPWLAYKDQGWISMGDWLGTGSIASFHRKYRTYEETMDYAQKLRIKSSTEWRDYWRTHKRPEDIPANPDRAYKEVWNSWGHFLGTDVVASQLRRYLPFEEARAYIHKLGLKNQGQWKEYCRSGKRPSYIPGNPWQVYQDQGWTGYGDWLGTGRIANKNKQFWSFKKARAYVRKLELQNLAAWTEYCASGKKPSEIPTNPAKTYKGKGWMGLRDWLG